MTEMLSLLKIVLKTDEEHQAPGHWRSTLLNELGSTTRSTVAGTCRSGLRLLLEEWSGSATLTIRVQSSSVEPPEALLQRAKRVSKQLAERTEWATQLSLVQEGDIAQTDTCFSTILNELTDCGNVTALSLSVAHITPQLMSEVEAALPQLESLVLSTGDREGTAELPDPDCMPDIEHLTVHAIAPGSQAGLWTSIGPFLPQLVTLTIAQQPGPALAAGQRPGWVNIFRYDTDTLTRLTLPCQLQPWLARLLHRQAPALKELTVSSVKARARNLINVPRVCSWNRLRLTHSHRLQAAVCEWLPLPETGELSIELCRGEADDDTYVDLQLPLSETVQDKLRRIAFNSGLDLVWVEADHDGFEDHQPTELREALAAIEHLACPSTELKLDSFTMSEPLATVVAAAEGLGFESLSLSDLSWPDDLTLPSPLPPLTTIKLDCALNDKALTSLRKGLSAIEELTCTGLDLRAPLPVGAVVPWQELEVVPEGSVDYRTILAQSRLLWGKCAWRAAKVTICLSLQEASNERALERTTKELESLCVYGVEEVEIIAPDNLPIAQHGFVVQECISLALSGGVVQEDSTITYTGWADGIAESLTENGGVVGMFNRLSAYIKARYPDCDDDP